MGGGRRAPYRPHFPLVDSLLAIDESSVFIRGSNLRRISNKSKSSWFRIVTVCFAFRVLVKLLKPSPECIFLISISSPYFTCKSACTSPYPWYPSAWSIDLLYYLAPFFSKPTVSRRKQHFIQLYPYVSSCIAPPLK